MGVFKEFYLNSYLVGEGLSGFIPSLAALAQGVGGNPYCDNVTYVDGNDTLIVSILLSALYTKRNKFWNPYLINTIEMRSLWMGIEYVLDRA